MLAYQVCECTRSAPTQSAAMPRSTPRVCRAGLAAAICGGYSLLRMSTLTRVTLVLEQGSPRGLDAHTVPTMSKHSGNPKVLAIVLAGRCGKRLLPLTADRAKPAVPFGGIYRLIDFALSNIVNSGYLKVVVLTQYKSHSLDRHIAKTWRMSNMLGNYVAPVPAQQRVGKRWYAGSADAIFQSLNLVHDEKP